MDIKKKCSFCNGEGQRYVGPTGAGAPPRQLVSCTECGGTGYVQDEVLDDTFDDAILAKLDEIKTKVNQMQADINWIKAKL